METVNMDDLALEQTWNKFYSLGDWVKNIPKLLRTLYASKNEEEVTIARKILAFDFQAAFERKENKENQEAYKLCDLLSTVIKFVLKILASEAIQQGLLLSNIIDLTHLINGSRTNEMDWLCPLYNLRSIYGIIGDIFERAESEKDLLFLQSCCYLMSIRNTISNDGDTLMVEKSISLIENCQDDVTQAAAMFAIHGIITKNGMLLDDTLEQALSTARTLLTKPDPSLAKLAAAITIASREFTKVGQDIALILADYLCFIKDYNSAFSKSPFKHEQLQNFIEKAVPREQPVIEWFADRAVQHLKVIEKSEESQTSIVQTVGLFLEIVCKDRIDPGMKVTDLPSFVVNALDQLVKMEKIWEIDGIHEKLSSCGILANSKQALRTFLDDTSDAGKKKFPKFAGMEKIDWANLSDAYGPATKVPTALRNIISTDAQKRIDGWNIMYSNVLHQGSLFSASPHVVPFLMEILDCDNGGQDLHSVLKFLQGMLGSTYSYVYSAEAYDIDILYPPEEDNEEDYGLLIRQVHDYIRKDIHILFKLLLDDSSHAVGAGKIIQFLHKSVDLEAVEKLKEAIDKHNEDWSVKGELLWSLSYLYPKIAPRDECLDYFMKQWKNFQENGELNVYIGAGLSRFYFPGSESAPKFLVDLLVDLYVTATGDMEANIAISTLLLIKSELALPGLLQKFKELINFAASHTLVSALLDIAFRFELGNNKPIIGSALKPHQIEVLQALIDKPQYFESVHFHQYAFASRRLPSERDEMEMLVEEAKASKEVDIE